MKTQWIALLAVGVLASVPASGVQAQTIQVSKENKTIAITTTDSAEAEADTADVSVGFTVYGTDKDAAYADGSRISNQVMSALTGAGIRQDQIRSEQQQISEVGSGDKARYDKGLRFYVSQSWRVTVKASAAADTLHLAVTNGANNGGNIDWRLADDSVLDAQAAEKALEHAQQIAARMANGLHTKLGPLVYASNQVPERPMPMMMRSMSMASPPRAKTVMPLAIAPDKVSRSATVYAVFSVE